MSVTHSNSFLIIMLFCALIVIVHILPNVNICTYEQDFQTLWLFKPHIFVTKIMIIDYVEICGNWVTLRSQE